MIILWKSGRMINTTPWPICLPRVRGKGWGGDPRSGQGLRTLYVAPEGDLVQPRTGKPQPPAPLDGEALPFDDPQDRRLALADWVTNPENPYFSRAIANRVWANFFGVGLVDPTDDLRVFQSGKQCTSPRGTCPMVGRA